MLVTNFAKRYSWALLFAAAIAATTTSTAQDKPQAEQKSGEGSIAYWVTQLASDHYLRRETAAQKLAQAGPSAIPDLIQVMQTGDLEVVERASNVITEIAVSGSPQEDGGAWDKLNELKSGTVGRVASRAQTAVDEIRKHRSVQARTELNSAGVFVGIDEFVIQARSQPSLIVQIDEKWNGDVEALQWLKWLDGIPNARVKGPAIEGTVLAQITKVPDLKSLAIVDGTVDDEVLQPLLEMNPLNDLEFRYVRLNDEQAEKIATMPVRVSMNLMGTGLSAEKVESMRASAPGLAIDHRQGGFLGVTCQDSFDICEISSVIAKSAAEDAGLIRGDVVLKLDDTVVTRFKDLQDAINQHIPGDTVKVTFQRAEITKVVDLQLRRFED
ncbi:PDZ domain-containing protein [Rubripirellula reticaptiva]|uniref:Serine protease Do-like HtrA n=1 Tax=Rubripirellula reticaptiva TaxID=2528013 RepID=A0A5C6EE20_9BACT|nr:PDZ domain-containing protein [Rubripirellula reticaptiva]TWU47993.1 Serine protease Do-like HtrA [Rubripirellula reticaptiva]